MNREHVSKVILITIVVIAISATAKIVSLGYMMNALPVSQSHLNDLSSEHVGIDVEEILGPPTYKDNGVWIYSRSGLWTKIMVFFDTDGHFLSYEIDY